MIRKPGYPPHHPWDPRMLEREVCPNLQPVRTVHSNPWFEVRKRGDYYTYETREAQGVVLPVVDGQAVVLVRVHRPVMDDIPLELPAGGFDLTRESPEEGMRRELAEETGITVPNTERFKPLPPVAVSPNRNPRLIFPLRVDISRQEFEQRGTHDSEISEVLCLPFEHIARLIANGEIYVALPLAMLSRLLLEIQADAK
jgi:ADP-ribose pyrophosphatase